MVVPGGMPQGEPVAVKHLSRSASGARASWSARSTAIVSLLIGLGAGVIIIEHLGSHIDLAAGVAERASVIVDAMALGIAVLSFAALDARNRIAPDRLNLITGCVIGVLAILVLPMDLIFSSAPSAVHSALVVATRTSLVLLSVVVFARSGDQQSSRLGQSVVAVVGLTFTLAALIVIAHSIAGFDQVALQRSALGVSSLLFVLGALRVGARSLVVKEPRGYVLALTLVAMGVADAHSTFFEHASLSMLAGKSIRLVVVAAILIYTVIELRELAISERESASAARDESAWSADRLVAQMAFQERFVHDTRNALLAIQGGVRSLGHGSNVSMAEAVSSEVDRLRTLLEGNGTDPLPAVFDLVHALRPMISCYEAAGQDIHLTVAGPVLVHGRPSIAAEVAQNLIENAIAHGNGSGITVWIFEDNSAAEVRVADRGQGVDIDLRDLIFEHGMTGGSGSGVGLNISKRLIEAQGGSLTVTERHGGGAIFAFRLPKPMVPTSALASGGARR